MAQIIVFMRLISSSLVCNDCVFWGASRRHVTVDKWGFYGILYEVLFSHARGVCTVAVPNGHTHRCSEKPAIMERRRDVIII